MPAPAPRSSRALGASSCCRLRRLAAIAVACASAAAAACASASPLDAAPLRLTQSPDGASFSVGDARAGAWLASAGVQLGGAVLPRADALPPRRYRGTDGLGAFEATALAYRLPGAEHAVLTATTKTYAARAADSRMFGRVPKDGRAGFGYPPEH